MHRYPDIPPATLRRSALIAITLSAASIASSLAGLIVEFEHDNHTYQIWGNDGTTDHEQGWTAARDFARTLTLNEANGDLARVDSAAENAAIFAALQAHNAMFSSRADDGGGARYAWIGANDIQTEGVWVWSRNGDQFWESSFDGEGPVGGLYSNWGESDFGGEPDNSPGFNGLGQNAAGIALDDWPFGEAGQWNDIETGDPPGFGNRLPFVIEFETTRNADPPLELEIVEITPDRTAGTVNVVFTSSEGTDYSVLTSSDLVNWQEAGTITGEEGTTSYLDTAIDFEASPKLFYRVETGQE